jgi:hypothetical protein
MRAMEEEFKVNERIKDAWHEWCIYYTFLKLLKEHKLPNENNVKDSQKKDSLVRHYIPLSFEIVGSKKFIAKRLREELDNPHDLNFALKELAQYRNNTLQELNNKKSEDEQASFFFESIKKIDPFMLLPFIRSLEEPIKKRIEEDGRTTEIEWRKGAYRWINCKTNRCIDPEECLKLDIEKVFTQKELRSGDYVYYGY